ncbi:hypothetical protein GN956_G24924 [Arapaima gigas]
MYPPFSHLRGRARTERPRVSRARNPHPAPSNRLISASTHLRQASHLGLVASERPDRMAVQLGAQRSFAHL